MSFERWNTHFCHVVEQEVFGVDFKLAQDPNSHNLGTTVWDASIVLAKWLEKTAKRGDFSRVRARGRRCLELGSGMGLGGLAFALLGADVTLTDLEPVLPLLARNYQANLSPAVLRVGDAAWAAEVVGRVEVKELDWSRPEQYANFSPPYDYILAADCVYSELAVPSFLATILHMSDTRTSTVVVNEFRSQSVHDTFMAAFTRHFTLKKVPPSKMDPHYQHPLIHIYILKRRKQPLSADAGAEGEAALVVPREEGEEPVHGDRGGFAPPSPVATSADGAAAAAAGGEDGVAGGAAEPPCCWGSLGSAPAGSGGGAAPCGEAREPAAPVQLGAGAAVQEAEGGRAGEHSGGDAAAGSAGSGLAGLARGPAASVAQEGSRVASLHPAAADQQGNEASRLAAQLAGSRLLG